MNTRFYTKYMGWMDFEEDMFPVNPNIGDVFTPFPEMDFTYDDKMYDEPGWVITREDSAKDMA